MSKAVQVTYEARTIKEMLGGLYDLVTIIPGDDALTPEQRNTIRRLYREIDPHKKLEEHFIEEAIHASR
jgi:hypothetical protein